ncbi:MAG: DUF1304 domain-containing protein [Myxococcales bacterium]|nr:DUF1304 domain-containing protein [Myxococcales bacterium]
MNTASRIATSVVALLHGWFFVLETLLWKSELAQKLLVMTAAEAEANAVLAGNQGVYNLVFAVGLGFSVVRRDTDVARAFERFFLISAIGVGVYGAVSARVTVLFVQVVPAAIALGLSMSRKTSSALGRYSRRPSTD